MILNRRQDVEDAGIYGDFSLIATGIWARERRSAQDGLSTVFTKYGTAVLNNASG
jgi:hypothetical protein